MSRGRTAEAGNRGLGTPVYRALAAEVRPQSASFVLGTGNHSIAYTGLLTRPFSPKAAAESPHESDPN